MKAIRTSKSRKISEEACLSDTLSRMWDKSNPYINSFQPVVHPRSRARRGSADPLEAKINDLYLSGTMLLPLFISYFINISITARICGNINHHASENKQDCE